MDAANYHFGAFEWQSGSARLLHSGEVVALEPKVLSVLAYLVEHRDRVVPKQELLRALWPDEVVTEAVLPNNVAVLRRALGQQRGDDAPIQTAHGRGYRFAAPVWVETGAAARAGAAADALVGRDAQLRRIRARFDAALAGEGGLLWLEGESGSGKSRLLDAAQGMARDRGLLAVAVRCATPGAGDAPGDWPLSHLLRRVLADGRPWSSEAETAAEAATAVGGTAGTFAQVDALVRLGGLLARERPMVWLVDDVDAAPEDTLRGLSLLCESIRALPLAIIATGELPAGRAQLTALSRSRAVERLALQPLDHDAVATILRCACGSDVPEEVATQVRERSAGLPWLVCELTDGLRDASGHFDAVAYETKGVRLTRSAAARLRTRFAGLGDQVRDVLEAASVFEDGVSLALLRDVAGVDGDALLDALDAAVDRGVMVSEAGRTGRYRFRTDALRWALYEGLSSPRRVRLHRLAGEALEAAGEGVDAERLTRLAHHFVRALPGHDPAPAVDHARRAAALWTAAGQHHRAVALHRQALRALAADPGADPTLRGELLLAIAEGLLEAGRVDELGAACDALMAHARAHGAWALFGMALRILGAEASTRPGRRLLPRVLLDEALARLPPGHGRLHAELLVDRARCEPATEAARERWLAEAESMSEGDQTLALEVESARLEGMDALSDAERVLAVSEEILGRGWPPRVDRGLAGGHRGDDWRPRFAIRRQRMRAALVLGRWADADADNARCESLAEDAGWPLAGVACGLHRVGRLLAAGHCDAAWELATGHSERARAMNSIGLRLALASLRSAIGAARGTPAEVHYPRVVGLIRRAPGLAPESMVAGAWVLSRGGPHTLVEGVIDSVMRGGLDALSPGAARLPTLVKLAHLSASLRLRRHAPALRAALAPFRGGHAVAGSGELLGPAVYAEGRLSALLDDDDAVPLLRQAVAALDDEATVVPGARARLDLIALLLDGDAAGGAVEAGQLLSSVEGAIRRFGLYGLEPGMCVLAARLAKGQVG